MRVAVLGAGGAMGTAVCRAVLEQDDMELVGAVDPAFAGMDLSQVTGLKSSGLILGRDVTSLSADEVDVVVDFSRADASVDAMRWCSANRVCAVVGTTGISEEIVGEMASLFGATSTGAIVASNFAIGAILMMRFAAFAAPYFDSAEIVEMHHTRKLDAPSGTALSTAELMAKAREVHGRGPFSEDPTERETLPHARGARTEAGVQLHSLRIHGTVAHQEVILGAAGQTLTLRHDTYDRTSFMPGILMGVRSVMALDGLVLGLDWLFGDLGINVEV